MRHSFLAGLVPIVLAAAASAAPVSSPLQPLVASDLPVQCRDVAVVPASATVNDPDFAAHISAASCLAESAMSALALRPDAASLGALDTATAPSRAILEDVIQHGGDHWKAVAETTKADLLNAMAVRIRIVANDPTDHAGIEPELARWQAAADRATVEAARLSRGQPIG